jgi:excinuclease ABC subunit C
MKDLSGSIIYVGKAKILPKRVSSYFRDQAPSVRIGLMVSQVESFDFVVTTNEKEALLLENSLIKKHLPKYNVILRDDKTYPSLRLSVKDPFPRLEIVRRPLRDGSIIFGPFPSSGSLRETLKMVNRLFPLRKCKREDVKKTDRPCLNFQIGQCTGPCRPEVTSEEYRQLTDQVRLFFRGRKNELVKRLETDMFQAAEKLDFETAATLRNRLHDVRRTLERQTIALSEAADIDVWALERQGDFGQAVVLNVRSGAVTGCRPLAAEGTLGGDLEAIISLITQYYGDSEMAANEILLPALPPGPEIALTAGWLSGLKGSPVKITTTARGEKLRLLEMASENARVTLEERLERLTRTRGVMAELMARLQLPSIPKRIECFDLAHIQGTNVTAGMVVMEEGEFKKSQYRKFKINQAKGGDDYAGLTEVIGRRFRPDRPQAWPNPDLLLIDGGRGQLTAVLAAFDELGTTPPPLAGIAKERGSVGADRIFLPGRKNPVDLKPGSASLLLLMKLRDEAHRFCRSYHHTLRTKELLTSLFSGIKGLGPARLKALTAACPTLESILAASDTQLTQITRLGPEGLKEIKQRASDLLKGRPHQDPGALGGEAGKDVYHGTLAEEPAESDGDGFNEFIDDPESEYFDDQTLDESGNLIDSEELLAPDSLSSISNSEGR